jgi:hypothetical protein
MSDLLKTLEEMAQVREEADTKCSQLFCKAVGDPEALTKDWPPEGIELITEKELQDNTYHVKETPMPWVIMEDIPKEMITVEETTGTAFVDLDYAGKHGYSTNRVMSRRIQGDMNVMGTDLDKVRAMLSDEVTTLKEEIAKHKDVKHLTAIGIYAHMEGHIINVFMACIFTQNPTPERLAEMKMSELHHRMLDLLKAIPALNDKDTEPSLKDWVWELTPPDAELAVLMMTTTNPGSEVIQSPEDLLKLTLMGVKVKSVDAKDTGLQVNLQLGKK